MKSKITFQSSSVDARLASKISAQEVVDVKSEKTILKHLIKSNVRFTFRFQSPIY